MSARLWWHGGAGAWRRLVRVLLLAGWAFGGTVSGIAAAGELRDFDARSPAAIRVALAGRPFILAFWSVTCVPCREELPHWGVWQRQYPAVPIVLVAADAPEDREAVQRVLAGQALGKVATWAFVDDYAERVRWAVDPAWRGEVPRTYFFDAAHRPEVKVGRLDAGFVTAWLARQAAAGGSSVARR